MDNRFNSKDYDIPEAQRFFWIGLILGMAIVALLLFIAGEI